METLIQTFGFKQHLNGDRGLFSPIRKSAKNLSIPPGNETTGETMILEPRDLGDSTCRPPPSMSMDSWMNQNLSGKCHCLVVEPTLLKNMRKSGFIKFVFQNTTQMSYIVIGNMVQFRMNQHPLWGAWGSHPLTNSLVMGQHFSTRDGNFCANQIMFDPPRGSVRENKDYLQEILVSQVGRWKKNSFWKCWSPKSSRESSLVIYG